MPMSIEDLETRFIYHQPTDQKIGLYDVQRTQFIHLAQQIDHRCPDSREKSLAFTKLEEALFWANAAIARNPT